LESDHFWAKREKERKDGEKGVSRPDSDVGGKSGVFE
jgi:hypothetical protein